jgi:hypothetical protein
MLIGPKLLSEGGITAAGGGGGVARQHQARERVAGRPPQCLLGDNTIDLDSGMERGGVMMVVDEVIVVVVVMMMMMIITTTDTAQGHILMN